MALHLHRPHHTTRGAARRRVEAVARDLAEELNLNYRWVDDRLMFQRLGAKGAIMLDDTHVHVHVTRSPFLPVSEAWLREQIEYYLDEHLPAPPTSQPEASQPEASQPAASQPEAPAGDPKASPRPGPRPTRSAQPNHVPPNSGSQPKTQQDHSFLGRLTHLAESMGTAAMETTAHTAQAPLKLAEALLGGQEPTTSVPTPSAEASAAGHMVRERRQQLDLSLATLAERLEVVVPQQLRAIEAGTARPSFHVMLGLAAHLASDNPITFLLPLARAHYPEIWGQIQALGLLEFPELTAREQRLVDVYRNHPDAYRLSEDAFDEVLRLIRANFDAAIDLERRGSG